MGNVHIDNLTPGMIPAADVYDRSGRLLLGGGAELTDKHIHIFRTWGVIEVDIIGVEQDNDDDLPGNAIDPATWERLEAGIRPLFRHTDPTHPAIKELMRLSILRRTEHGNR